jgi:hypothetical protein
MAYPNIAGTSVNLTDGNLRQVNNINEPGVLIVGRAESGPTSSVVSVASVSDAANTYGRSSDLFKGMAEAAQGGSLNLLGYRLAGVAPSLTNLGSEFVVISDGEDPPALTGGIAGTGFTVVPALESAEAASVYAVAYQSSVNKRDAALPGIADASAAVNELVVLNTQTGKVVFHGTATQTFLDLGEVTVTSDVFNNTQTGLDVVTVTFATTSDAPGVMTFFISGRTFNVTVDSGKTATEIGASFVSAFNGTDLDTVFTAVNASGTVTITANGNVSSDGVLRYPTGHPQAGRPARPVVYNFDKGLVGATTVTVNKTAGPEAFDVGWLPLYIEDPMSTISGGGFVTLSQVPLVYDAFNTVYTNVNSDAFAPKATIFTPGETMASTSYMKLYEKLDEAYSLLSFRSFDLVVPQGIKLDAGNVAELSPAQITELDLASLTDYPPVGGNTDVLGKLAKVLNPDGFTYTYYWDTNNDGFAEVASNGVPGGAPAGLIFHEVSFAHQLALFCYKTSEDFNFCHGMLATSVPRTLDPRTIRTWAGKSPGSVYDARLEKYIIPSGSNGNGLLGHKLVGGRSDFYFGIRRPGIPLLVDETFGSISDPEKLVTDSNGVVVDLAKYISVVAAFGNLRNDYNSVRGGYTTNLASWYAGKVSTLAPSNAPTNKPASNVGMIYEIDPRIVDEFAGNRVVCLFKKDGVPTIPDAPTFAAEGSDYKRLTTMRIVHAVVKGLRAAADPFLGEGLSTQKRAALDTALQGVILENMGTNITNGNFTVKQTAAERVEGRMRLYVSLVPIFELRKINVEISLSAGE